MRDYQFGDWIASLRQNSGYSQFQLGKLLGVSDKAVSKWETGAAKPRTETCARMASIFGISLDDLMACQQPKEVNRMYSKQGESEETLWQEARDILHKIYGDDPPLAFQSRLNAEEVLMRGTGMIRHLKLQGQLWKHDVTNEAYYGRNQKAMLTAWLLDASFINPLQPHTVCPVCHRTVLHTEVKDGWDLPETICDCGASLIRDGHDIPLDLCEQDFSAMNRSFIIEIQGREEAELFRLISEQYDDNWVSIQYQKAVRKHNNLRPKSKRSADCCDTHGKRYYALLPRDTYISFPKKNGIYQLSSNDDEYNLAKTSEVILYIRIEGVDQEDELESTEKPACLLPRLTVDDLLKPDVVEKARLHIGKVQTTALHHLLNEREVKESNRIETIPGTRKVIQYQTFMAPGTKEVYQHETIEEDITCFLPEKLSFSTIMNVLALCDSMKWFGFLSYYVHHGLVSLQDVPASQEDLFAIVKQKLMIAGIYDRGIAQKMIAWIREKVHDSSYIDEDGTFFKDLSCQEQPNEDEILKTASALGFEEWFMDYLWYLHRSSLRDKQDLVFMSYYLLYRIAARKAAGIDEDEYLALLRSDGYYEAYSEKYHSFGQYYETVWNAIMTKTGW